MSRSEPLQQPIKYLVAATPRAATAYTAELLSNLGLNCRHEEFFRFVQRQDAFLSAAGVLGEASWLAVPFLKSLPESVRILHQTRHPLVVVRSLLRGPFFDVGEAPAASSNNVRRLRRQFAGRHCPELLEHEDAGEFVAWLYYRWNRLTEQVTAGRAALRFDVDGLTADRLGEILSFIGIPDRELSEELLAAHLALLPGPSDSAWIEEAGDLPAITWDELPSEVHELARSYGYGPPEETARPEQPPSDAAAGGEELRTHLRIVQRDWARQRESLLARISELDNELRRVRRQVDEHKQQAFSPRDEIEFAKERTRQNNWMCAQAEGPRVLDVGCGEGTRSIMLARAHESVTGIDEDAAAIERAEAALQTEPEAVRRRVRFEHVTLLTAEYEPAAFDTILLGDVLTQVTQPARLLAKANELLPDSGRLVVCVPLGYRLDPRHVHSFYPAGLLGLVAGICNLEEFRVVCGHLCLVATKPPNGRTASVPTREVIEAWRELGEEALEDIERRWSQQAARQRRSADEVKRAAADAAQLKNRLQDASARLEATQEALSLAQSLNVHLARDRAVSSAAGVAPLNGDVVRPSDDAGGVLFFCVNGAGLGHLTRSLAIARRMRRINPSLPIYFLSSSQAIQIISREGMIAYHIPPRNEYGQQMGGNSWNNLLLQTLRVVVATHRPTMLVYDGVSTYRGLLNAIGEAQFAHAAMILRLRHKHERLESMTDELTTFHELILPGEPGVEVPFWLTALNHRVFDPIIFLDHDELLPREEARRFWNIPSDKKAVYVQLGAGNIDDTSTWISRALRVLGERDDVEVVLAESPIAKRAHAQRPGVHILSQYPNSLFCNGFDLAITAAGYNTFHELMHFGVPTVFVPNQHTLTDDQVARATTAAQAGAASVALEQDQLTQLVKEALADNVARSMRQNARKLVPRNGARDVAEQLLATASRRVQVRDSVGAEERAV